MIDDRLQSPTFSQRSHGDAASFVSEATSYSIPSLRGAKTTTSSLRGLSSAVPFNTYTSFLSSKWAEARGLVPTPNTLTASPPSDRHDDIQRDRYLIEEDDLEGLSSASEDVHEATPRLKEPSTATCTLFESLLDVNRRLKRIGNSHAILVDAECLF